MQIDLQSLNGACACKKVHTLYTREVVIARGAISMVPEMLSRYGYRLPLVVCDANTYAVAGEAVCAQTNAKAVVLQGEHLHADEHAVNELTSRLPNGVDVLLAVGAGTIHDVVRYTAFSRGIPFISVPTAASVDGFVSTVAAMTWRGLKKSFASAAPVAVAADTDILMRAPYRLTASGVSDLMGKYTAIADWRIAHLVTGEYICERICTMALDAVAAAEASLMDLRKGEADAYERLMYGLLLSGLAMQMVGNSRPASGAEHHLSHLWEMEAITPALDALHGEKVCVGLMLLLPVYESIGCAIREGRCGVIPYEGLELCLLEPAFPEREKLRGILEENAPDPLETVDLPTIKSALPAIEQVLGTLPKHEFLNQELHLGGCKQTLEEIGLHSSVRELSLSIAPYVRNRLTLLRLSKLLCLTPGTK